MYPANSMEQLHTARGRDSGRTVNPIPTPVNLCKLLSLEMYPSKSLLAEELPAGMFLW